jgi:hypothetical protein
LADHVLGQRLIADEAQSEPVHPHMMAREQHAHGQLVARRDPLDQRLVRSGLPRRRPSVQNALRDIDPNVLLCRHGFAPAHEM